MNNVNFFYIFFLILGTIRRRWVKDKGRVRNHSYPQGTEWYIINENSSLYEDFFIFIYQIIKNNTYEKEHLVVRKQGLNFFLKLITVR